MYKFKDKRLYDIVFTHPSYRENKEFQRLEFLGDKVLSYHLSKMIFTDENLSERDLSIALSNLVNKDKLGEIGHFICPSIKYSGNLSQSMIADCFEAWIGAIEIEGGPNMDIIYNLFEKDLLNVIIEKNPKNLLQEFAQSIGKQIVYLYKQDGLKYESIALLENFSSSGFGCSKKKASEDAAKNLLELLEKK